MEYSLQQLIDERDLQLQLLDLMNQPFDYHIKKQAQQAKRKRDLEEYIADLNKLIEEKSNGTE